MYDTYTAFNHYDQSTIDFYKPQTDNDPHFSQLTAINKDVCGWINIENTHIDYPILQGKDNTVYINKDFNNNYALIGSIFLDYRNNRYFTDFYSLIYGHSMDGNRMFGELPHFLDKDYFNIHHTGSLYVDSKKYNFTIFASLYTHIYDSTIYRPEIIHSLEQKEYFLNHLKNNAVHYRDISIKEDDLIIGMSTCSTTESNKRVVVFAKIEK